MDLALAGSLQDRMFGPLAWSNFILWVLRIGQYNGKLVDQRKGSIPLKPVLFDLDV